MEVSVKTETRENEILCAVRVLRGCSLHTTTPTLTYFARSLCLAIIFPASIQYGYHLSCVVNL